MRGVCPFHRYARAVMAGEKRRRDACPARGNWFLESGRGRITSSAPFLQAHRRCHSGGKARCAEFVLFTGMRIVMVGEKRRRDVCPAHGNPSGEAGAGALRRACPFSQLYRRCHGEGKRRMDACPTRGSGRKCAALSAPFLQAHRRCHSGGKARCAEFVLFTGMRVVMARKKCRRDAFPARGNASGKAEESAPRRARPFSQARRRR